MKSATILAPEGRARLRAWIDRRGLTQEDAAKEIGVHRVHLNYFLTGERRPGLDTALLIEESTGIPMRTWARPTSLAARRDETGEGAASVVNHNDRIRTQTLRQFGPRRKVNK